MELFYERNFYGVLGLLIAACIAMYRFFTKTQAQQLENTNLKLEIKINDVIKKEIKDSERRMTEIIKEELKEAREDFNNSKDHAIKNLKHLIALFNQNIAYEYTKFEESSNKKIKEMQVIKEANDNKIANQNRKSK